MKKKLFLLCTFVIITSTISQKFYFDPKYFGPYDPERFSGAYDIKIPAFDDFIKSTNNTPVIYAERYEQIFLSCEPSEEMNRAKLTWKHNGETLNMPPPYQIPWDKGSVLMIRPLIKERTGGYYECIADLLNGRIIVRREVFVNVVPGNQLPKGFPRIVTHPQNIISPRKQVDFNCVVSGDSPVQIVWYKNRKPVSKDKNHISSMSMVGENFSSNLMINYVSEKDQGFYQCIAFNKFGQVASRQATIHFKRRYRKSIQNWGSSFIIGDCKREEGLKFPDPIKVIGVECESTPQDGKYLSIYWTIGQQITKNITTIVVSFLANDSYTYCFRLPGTARAFKFKMNDGFDLYTKFRYTVLPNPRPEGEETEYEDIKMNICNNSPPKIDNNRTVTSDDGDDGDETERSLEKMLGVVFGSIAGVFCLAMLLIIIYKQCVTKTSPSFPLPSSVTNDIYVSHCSMKKQDEERVCSFFKKLHSYGIKVNADLFNLSFMERNGGRCKWIPEFIATAKKIIMIITPAYLKVIKNKGKSTISNQTEALKVQTEFNHIQARLYDNARFDRSQVILLLDSHVKSEDLPRSLYLCPKYSYTKMLNKGDEKELNLLLGVLKRVELVSYEA